MIERDAFIVMSDGVRLAATLYVPETEGPWPVVMEALPYRKDDVTRYHSPEYRRLADEGDYVVCRIDLRGTGSSQGVAVDEYHEQEQRDLCEAIAWLAEQEWSTGAVAMYGASYGGFNSIQAAMLRPPALKAIVPIYATDDRYNDDVHYYGGVRKQLDFVDYPTYMIAMNALPPVPSIYGEGWRDEWRRRLDALEPWMTRWAEEQQRGEYWKHGSLCEDYTAISCATMIVAGWADGYRNATFRMFEQLECPKRMLIGPWGHMAPESAFPGPNIDLVPELIRFFDRHLRGTDDGLDGEPPITLFVRRSTKPAPDLGAMRGEWRREARWPPDGMREQATALAEQERVDVLDVRPDVGMTGWISCAGGLPWGTPCDQRPDEAYSLVYDRPLEEELEILGYPRLEVRVAATAPVAFLSAKLCDVWPDGTSALVSRGFLNLTQRDSQEHPEPLEPGAAYDVTVSLDATSWVFEAGHRLRLDVAGSDWPNAWAPPRAHSLTVWPARSRLVLPVMEHPSNAGTPTLPPSTAERHTTHDSARWTVTQDVLGRTSRADVAYGSEDKLDNGTGYLERYEGAVEVRLDDPGTASARGHARFRVEWPEVVAGAEVDAQMRSTSDGYVLEIALSVTENDKEEWSRTWERAFPRRLN